MNKEGQHAAQAAMQIIGAYDWTIYQLVNRGEVVSAYVDAVDKEKRKEELMAQMEAKFKEIDKERKFEYYATLELYKEYKELCQNTQLDVLVGVLLQ